MQIEAWKSCNIKPIRLPWFFLTVENWHSDLLTITQFYSISKKQTLRNFQDWRVSIHNICLPFESLSFQGFGSLLRKNLFIPFGKDCLLCVLISMDFGIYSLTLNFTNTFKVIRIVVVSPNPLEFVEHLQMKLTKNNQMLKNNSTLKSPLH